jgi:chromosome partitioning protein
MEVIAIVNQKGGVGKTTSCINLASALAVAGKKILLIDLDPQGNSSSGLGVELENRKENIYETLINNLPIEKSSKKTAIENLEVCPATVDLSAAELEIAQIESREYLLKHKINQHKQNYDYIFIDCPPSLGMLTINALTAADSLIIPMQCEYFALEGLSHLLKTIKIIKSKLNENLEIKGILLSMYDKRNRLSAQVARDIKKYLGDKLFKTIIPRNVRVSEAPSFGKPVLAYDINCPGSKAFIRLTKEILTNNSNLNYKHAR